ncbi:unnamed protein product [Polarella glacialis]|uniref:RING-type E3 ubiquitin transferase n=1 Tax=Polarella glacialis TaxID=89957 RepID=A0A813HLF8_POLGL|nr:unnamed protein product [Polarella glacialis]
MRDPVATADGCIYERELIQRWILEKRRGRQAVISPSTGVELASQHLMPVNALKKAVETYVANRPELCSFFGQRRSAQLAAQLLQEELLEKQVRHNSIEDELDRLQKQMKVKDCHITEAEVLNQSLSEELALVRAELAERDARDSLLMKEVDELRQKHQCSQQEVSELRCLLVRSQSPSEEMARVRAELKERERDRLLRKAVDNLRQKLQCSRQVISELKSQLASAEASCKQLSSEFALAQDATSGVKGELSSSSSVVLAAQSQLCTPAFSDDPSVAALEADGSARAPTRAPEEIEEEGGDHSSSFLSNRTAEANTLEQDKHEQYQQQKEAASESGQSAFTICLGEVGLLSEPPPQSHAGFFAGQYAEIQGVWSLQELIGRLLEFDTSSGRWCLLLENGKCIRIRPEFMTHYDVPQEVKPMQVLLPGPSGASVTSRLSMSLMLATPPQICDAERLAERIGALAHEVFGNGAALEEFVHLGCLVSLVRFMLASESPVVHELAAYALRFVGSDDLIVRSGAIPCLVMLLFESSCSKVQKEAAKTLARHCRDSRCRHHIIDVCEELDLGELALLLVPGGANSQSVQSCAALLCGGLVQGSPPIRESLVKAGVVPQIIALLQLAPSTARQAAFALRCLLYPACEDIRQSIVEANVIPCLVGLLQSEFFQAREDSLLALKQLVPGFTMQPACDSHILALFSR